MTPQNEGGEMRDRAADFYVRSLNGRKLPEREFDAKVLPAKLKELVAKYDIRMKDDEVILRSRHGTSHARGGS